MKQKKNRLTINSTVLPIIEKLQKDNTLEPHKTDLNMLAAYMQHITSGLISSLDSITFLVLPADVTKSTAASPVLPSLSQ
jgi:hypothetical protein